MKLILVVLALSLVGCSSSPKIEAKKPQYCYTSQRIITEDHNTVSSRTELDCTDDQVKRLTTARMGTATNCGEFTYWMQIGGRDVRRKGISCQKLDGTWEVVANTR